MKGVPFTTAVIVIFSLLLTGCAAPPVAPDSNATLVALLVTLDTRRTLSAEPEITATSPSLVKEFVPRTTVPVTTTPALRMPATPTMTSMRSLLPEAWREWPVIPVLSQSAFERYWQGRLIGSMSRVFSVVGDCQSEPEVFLGVYERGGYQLGPEYAYLQETIDYYRGSFDYTSQAVANGMNVSSALSPDWADEMACEDGETPLECELRLRRPAIVLVNLGTNWGTTSPARYDTYLRQIVELILEKGALPVLSTKVDNVEGDHSINLAIARVAYDYELPLWNFWRAAQDLPNGGLDDTRDNIYLTRDGWNRHSFSALQVLDALRKELER
jgi:hypothetical protein